MKPQFKKIVLTTAAVAGLSTTAAYGKIPTSNFLLMTESAQAFVHVEPPMLSGARRPLSHKEELAVAVVGLAPVAYVLALGWMDERKKTKDKR
jgi:hypothetical protein